MKRFDDLSVQEKAELDLSSPEFESHVKLVCAETGINIFFDEMKEPRPVPPEMTCQPVGVIYEIQINHSAAFFTDDPGVLDILQNLRMIAASYVWTGNEQVYYLEPDKEMQISAKTIKLFNKSEIDKFQKDSNGTKTLIGEWDRRAKEIAEAKKGYISIQNDLAQQVYDARRTCERVGNTIQTLSSYVELSSGDPELATTFYLKANPKSLLSEAAEIEPGSLEEVLPIALWSKFGLPVPPQPASRFDEPNIVENDLENDQGATGKN